jgi:hypothetical protein
VEHGGVHNILAHGYTLTPPGELYFRILAGNYQAGLSMGAAAALWRGPWLAACAKPAMLWPQAKS